MNQERELIEALVNRWFHDYTEGMIDPHSVAEFKVALEFECKDTPLEWEYVNQKWGIKK